MHPALSVPCWRPELGLSDELGPSDELSRRDELDRSEVARASWRAASASGPTLARAESPRLPSLKHPRQSLPENRLFWQVFANPQPARSKKVIESKDPNRLTQLTCPLKPPK